MAKGIKAAPKKKKQKRLSEHARLVEERARSIPPGVVHSLFDTSTLPVPPPAPARHPVPGRLVSKPPPPPPRPNHRPEEGVEAELAELEELEELQEEAALEELEELDGSEESQTDGFGSHSLPPGVAAPSGAHRPWLRLRVLPLVLGAVVVGGLALATGRELGRSGGAAPRVEAIAATVMAEPAAAPSSPPAPVADALPLLPPGVTEAAPGASPATEVPEVASSPTNEAPNAAVVAVSPDAVSVAASNPVLARPAATGVAPSAPAAEPTQMAAFDAAVADAAIEAAFQRARQCRSASDPKGLATVTLTYAPSGRITTALVSGIFAGTSIGSCVAAALRSARIPPFTGALVTVKRSATLQ